MSSFLLKLSNFILHLVTSNMTLICVSFIILFYFLSCTHSIFIFCCLIMPFFDLFYIFFNLPKDLPSTPNFLLYLWFFRFWITVCPNTSLFLRVASLVSICFLCFAHISDFFFIQHFLWIIFFPGIYSSLDQSSLSLPKNSSPEASVQVWLSPYLRTP